MNDFLRFGFEGLLVCAAAGGVGYIGYEVLVYLRQARPSPKGPLGPRAIPPV